MNKPLTTDEAYVTFECRHCKEFPLALKRLRQFFKYNSNASVQPELFHQFESRSIDLEFVANISCDGDCVIGATSSTHCMRCKERIWFKWRDDIPAHFQCPYCHNTTYNSMAKHHNKMRAPLDTQ